MVAVGIKIVRFFLILTGISLSTPIIGQQIHSGKITYERRTNLHKKFTDAQTRDYIKEKDKIRTEDFVLYFNDTVSTFKPIYSDEADPLNWTTTKNSVLQSIPQNRKLTILSFAGQDAYVSDSLSARQWKITENTRVIAGYKCRKAVYQKDDSTRLYAWYCLEIEPAFGPEGFNGLPGMILGLATEDGGIIYFAKKIELTKPTQQELDIDTKKKKIFTMPELKAKLEKDFGDTEWGKRLFTDLFRWL